MRPINLVARDRLNAELRRNPPIAAAALAERLGVSAPTLLRMLRERPDWRTRAAIAEAFRTVGEVQTLLELLRSPAWQQQLNALPGYAADRSGEVLSLNRVLPWWHYRKPKA